jgi:hypothetical protein
MDELFFAAGLGGPQSNHLITGKNSVERAGTKPYALSQRNLLVCEAFSGR